MYDLIVLGGGPAGYNAAERAGHAGLKTVVSNLNVQMEDVVQDIINIYERLTWQEIED